METQNFDIREEVYNNVHNMKPQWWMRWGILTVFLIVLVIFGLGYAISYPDIIHSEIRITTNQPSVTLPLAPGSQIEKIFVNDRDEVQPETNLLVIKNNADYNDVFLLEKELKGFSFQEEYLIGFFQKFLNKNLQLGSIIDNDWITFSSELLGYYRIVHLDSYQSQIKFLRGELAKQHQLQKQYEELIFSDKKQKGLLTNKIQADSILYSKGVESRIEYNNNKQYYYSKTSELQQNSLALNRIKLEIVRLENAIKNHQNNEKESLVTQQLGIQKAYSKVKSSIATWKRSFVLTSPIKGKVSFIQNLEEAKYYEGNAIVVVSSDSQFYANINIPVIGAGKVKQGQKVMIKLNDYPYREYGVLEGKLLNFSPVAKDNFYIGKVALKKNERSSYGKNIKLKENMSGIGEVVTKDRNILERLFETILYVFNRK